jgi:uncharacterized membrane protein YfcA
MEIAGALAIGFAAGVTSGMLGVGGGILFVPALVVFLDQTQIEAVSTSLLAIVPVACVGVWRQHGYGNVRLREGLLIGLLAPPGVLIGTALSNTLSDRALTLAFAALMLFFAVSLARRALGFDARSSGD